MKMKMVIMSLMGASLIIYKCYMYRITMLAKRNNLNFENLFFPNFKIHI